MNTVTPNHSNVARSGFGWSNRILIIALAVILFLTLYPFRLDFGRHLERPFFPFSLGGMGKGVEVIDDFLNVLLFVPLGFGLSEKLRERGSSRPATFAITLAAGALLSYSIELLQIYIPQRDSGWEDVLTNSLGAITGALVFDLLGGEILGLLWVAESRASSWLTWRRAAATLALYGGCWCVIAAELQNESRLSNWNADSLLVVGNSASNRSAWRGRVYQLQIWDKAVSPNFARKLTSHGAVDPPGPVSVVDYKFTGSSPFGDDRHLLPDLLWTPEAPVLSSGDGAVLDGTSWLATATTVPALVGDLKKTAQLSLRVLCDPAEIRGVDSRIVSISSPDGIANMELRQQDAGLGFWLRTPLSPQRAKMSWVIPGVFAARGVRDILFTFDGARAKLFIDGTRYDGAYELGPGAALAKFVRHITAPELKGYRYVFYAIVFSPVGVLLGLACKPMSERWNGWLSALLLGFSCSILFEAVLAKVGGRGVSFENIWFSILVTAVGSLWIHADRAPWARPAVAAS